MSDDESWNEILRAELPRQRRYAGLREWSEKPLKEKGILGEFVEALEHEGITKITSWALQSEQDGDPPDGLLITAVGERWGVEITELVNQKAVELTQRGTEGQEVFAVWSDDEVIADLRSRISRKDAAIVRGGPYHRYILLVHTDEPLLSPARLRATLGSQMFQTKLIDAAYILAPYETEGAELLVLAIRKDA
jgi:hypothetical protein